MAVLCISWLWISAHPCSVSRHTCWTSSKVRERGHGKDGVIFRCRDNGYSEEWTVRRHRFQGESGDLPSGFGEKRIPYEEA